MTQKNNTAASVDRTINAQRLLWGASGMISTTALMLAPDFQTVAAALITSAATATAVSTVLNRGTIPEPRPVSFIVGVAMTPHLLVAAVPDLVQEAREQRRERAVAVEKGAAVEIPGFQRYNAQTNTLKLA